MKRFPRHSKTYAPSAFSTMVKASILFLFAVLLLLWEENWNNNGILCGILFLVILAVYIMFSSIMRKNNRLTIDDDRISFAGKSTLSLSEKKFALSWGDFDYCRTRIYYLDSYGSDKIIILDFIDICGHKIHSVRIDYFDLYYDIINTLENKGKLNKDKCLSPGVLTGKDAIKFLIYLFGILAVIILVLLYI